MVSLAVELQNPVVPLPLGNNGVLEQSPAVFAAEWVFGNSQSLF